MLALAKRKLRCSFCKKSETQVSRLIGGAAGGYICEDCVGVCNRILDAAPSPFKSWDDLTDEQLLTSIKASETSIAALHSLIHAQVAALRKREVSWTAIGKVLGVSRQAAWERFS
ncbi:MAG TPA: ClpX C4-type zinc finger protein [Methylocystis sp.]|jgi:ATP-dependent protease Clp ATPase subunit